MLNTTVLSNFAYNAVGDYPYLQSALDRLNDEISVVAISETVANREAVVSDHLDPGEVQAFALTDVHDGRLLTDDGDARAFAKEQGVTVVGSVACCWPPSTPGRSMNPPLTGVYRRGLTTSATTFRIELSQNIANTPRYETSD